MKKPKAQQIAIAHRSDGVVFGAITFAGVYEFRPEGAREPLYSAGSLRILKLQISKNAPFEHKPIRFSDA